jgi:hypothetical protein
VPPTHTRAPRSVQNETPETPKRWALLERSVRPVVPVEQVHGTVGGRWGLGSESTPLGRAKLSNYTKPTAVPVAISPLGRLGHRLHI